MQTLFVDKCHRFNCHESSNGCCSLNLLGDFGSEMKCQEVCLAGTNVPFECVVLEKKKDT